MVELQKARTKIKSWRDDPIKFVRDNFKAEPDHWQAEVLLAFTQNKRICLKASKGVGKTTLLSWLAWLFLCTRTHPKVIATSVSWDNLSDGLWSEMALWQQKSEFIKSSFTWTKTRISANDHPETWFMSARQWSKSSDSSQQANTLAGIHGENVLFLLDESGGIPDSVMSAAEAALSTGKDLKLVQAGNPTHLSGPLYRACTVERDLWYIKEISSDPEDPKRAQRVSLEWSQQQIQKYGRDNPWVMVNVFGKFPPNSINSLLGVDEVVAATKRKAKLEDYEMFEKRLGVDVARFGSDRTIIFPRQGKQAYKPVEMRNARSNEIAARVIVAKDKWKSDSEFVDGTGGFGSGVVDSMLQAGHSPYEVHFSGKAIDNRYLNKRGEMWFLMCEWIKAGGCIPDDPDLIKELSAPTYTFQNGKFVLESKDQIKQRLGFSPDKADALALTFYLPEFIKPNPIIAQYVNTVRLKSEYDPFEEMHSE